jgi:hypothetical protein
MKGLPERLFSYFWDVDPSLLDVESDRSFIIRRLFERGDLEEVRWLLRAYPPQELRSQLTSCRSLTPKSAQFWAMLLDVPPGELTCIRRRSGPRPESVWATLDGVKVSFFRYDYPLLERTIPFEEISVAGVRDIASMKLDTISSRGSRKDFVDLYFVCREGRSLQDVLSWFREKYAGIDYNQAHLLKSLTYFEDADRESDLRMLRPCSWEEVKRFFRLEVKKLVA